MITMQPITICFVYFKSLSLANLEAALYSVRRQNLDPVESILVIDNDTADSKEDIQKVIDALEFPVPVRLMSFKHNDPNRTHSWSTNVAVCSVFTRWVLFCRADYILDFDLVAKFVEVKRRHMRSWEGFITGNVYHLAVDVAQCEKVQWREQGPQVMKTLPGAVADYTKIDAGVWMTRCSSFHEVKGLSEDLTVWGHAQTHFQWKLHQAGVEFVQIPEVLFYHPQHAAPRDINLAHQQLKDNGIDLRELWARHDGPQPYGDL